MAAMDLTAFHDGIVGAQKTQAGTKISPLTGARGCVEFLGTAGDVSDPPRYRISVAWQGRQASALTANASTCASEHYPDAEKQKLRRVISLEVQVL
jgi:hypothetical protein